MKLLYSNLKNGEVRVLTQNPDDLWYLSALIEPKDIVKGRTFRKIKSADEERKRDAEKKPVFIKIEVKKSELSGNANVLRVSGVIREAPEDIPLGEHHTFNIDENTTITIIKEKWLKFQVDKLKESCSQQKSSVLICVHDREEAYFAILKKYGYEILLHISGDVQKKRSENKKVENFYATIIQKIAEYSQRHKIKVIVLASPAFWKEDLMVELKDEELRKKIILATCSSATRNAIDEVIKRPEVREALKLERAALEINKVEELLTEIAKNNLAVYGLKETQNACVMGAIKELLITDKLIQKSRNGDFYDSIESIMRTVDKSKGEIGIISSEHEGGKRLDGLGGIGAILRFKIRY